MVEYAKKWYRAKVLKDAGSKVLLEYQGYSHEGGPFWLAKDHSRIWRGSYKGRDWKYLVSWWRGSKGWQQGAHLEASCPAEWPWLLARFWCSAFTNVPARPLWP